MNKKVCFTETAYILGLIFLALGAACMEAADFGLSMVVAPAYLIYLKVSGQISFFTFGMAEYIMQALLLLTMILVIKKFKVSYLFSFVTAVLYGVLLDGMMKAVSFVPSETVLSRVCLYLIGLLACAIGVAFIFHTYIAPEVYELFVKEVSGQFKIPISRFKTWYDCISCILAVGMSFLFFGFGRFEGVKVGTVFCAIVNGWLIGKISRWMEERWEFRDAFRKKEMIGQMKTPQQD